MKLFLKNVCMNTTHPDSSKFEKNVFFCFMLPTVSQNDLQKATVTVQTNNYSSSIKRSSSNLVSFSAKLDEMLRCHFDIVCEV